MLLAVAARCFVTSPAQVRFSSYCLSKHYFVVPLFASFYVVVVSLPIARSRAKLCRTRYNSVRPSVRHTRVLCQNGATCLIIDILSPFGIHAILVFVN